VGKLRSGQMRWKWGRRKWKWDENENEVKVTWPGRKEGNAKEEGKSKHQHQHTWPGASQPWKGKRREKRRPTDTEQDQRRCGWDGSAWTNPTKRKPTPTSARAGPDLPRGEKRTYEKRSQKLNKSSLQGLSSTLDNRALFPKRDRSQVQPYTAIQVPTN
jgi:hypothetical protein